MTSVHVLAAMVTIRLIHFNVHFLYLSKIMGLIRGCFFNTKLKTGRLAQITVCFHPQLLKPESLKQFQLKLPSFWLADRAIETERPPPHPGRD